MNIYVINTGTASKFCFLSEDELLLSARNAEVKASKNAFHPSASGGERIVAVHLAAAVDVQPETAAHADNTVLPDRE